MSTLSPKSYKPAFAVVFAILVGIGITSYVMSDRFANSEELVIHTHRVLSEVKSVSTDLSEAKNSCRDYVSIGDPTLLIEYDVAVQTLPNRLKVLLSLTVDNPEQQQRLVQLEPLIAQRLALLTQAIQLRQQNPSDTGQQLEFARQGLALDDQIRPLLSGLEQEESRLLAIRSRVSAGKQHRATMILVLAFLLASMLLVSLFLLMSTEVTRRTWAELIARENEEKFRLLVNGIQDHAIIRVAP